MALPAFQFQKVQKAYKDKDRFKTMESFFLNIGEVGEGGGVPL